MKLAPAAFAASIALGLAAGGRSPSSIRETAYPPVVAETRVNDFYHGVYKKFLVHGPARIRYKVDKNYSINIALSGIMLDLTEECPPPYFQTEARWQEVCRSREVTLERTAAARGEGTPAPQYTTEKEAVLAAMGQLQDLQDLNPKWWAAHSRTHYVSLFRWLKARGTDGETLEGRAQCCNALALFDQWEDCQGQLGLTSARSIEKQLKWDGTTPSSSGAELRMISKFIEDHNK